MEAAYLSSFAVQLRSLGTDVEWRLGPLRAQTCQDAVSRRMVGFLLFLRSCFIASAAQVPGREPGAKLQSGLQP